MEEKTAAFDNRVSTITAVKAEPRDTDGPKNAVSVLIAPGAALLKLNKEDEAERAAVRSNQQAKIPLKKRDLKLAGCFQTNHLNNASSSIIVCNPSVINSKDCRGRDGKPINSLELQGSPATCLQQVITSRQELTNGRAPHPPPRDGHNGVIGQVGVIGHVGVIRSPPELHRAPEENGPKSEPSGVKAGEEVSRQSVLVRKGPPEQDAAAALPAHPIPPLTDQKSDLTEIKGESVGFPSQMTVNDQSSGQPEENRNVKEEPGINSGRAAANDYLFISN